MQQREIEENFFSPKVAALGCVRHSTKRMDTVKKKNILEPEATTPTPLQIRTRNKTANERRRDPSLLNKGE
jgi:hypothetical protein